MISPRSDVNERSHRFHPNDVLLQPPTNAFIAGRTLEDETAVRSCKHCSFAFRTGLNDPDIDGYCSKDCRVCHTWFTGSTHSSKSFDPPTRCRSSSPRWKSQHKDVATGPQINQNSNPTACTSTSVNYYKNKMKEHHFHVRSKSEKSESYGTTWRVCNPKGEKIILPSNSSKNRRTKYNTSLPSTAVEVTTSPVLPSPNFHRVLSYFY